MDTLLVLECAGQDPLKEDGINVLPDDILLHIVSSLTTKEAGRTSVLSKRCKHLWEYITTLDFDSRKIIDELELETTSLQVEEPKYLRWIDQVVSSHKAPIIDEFRVRFDFDSVDNIKSNIDNWLRFAMEKRVKRLEMDFSVYKGGRRTSRYNFPQGLSCNSLTSLQLGRINVTGEIIESFLYNCLALEHLSVTFSLSLVELTVEGPSLKLKTLTIYCCSSMGKLEISAPNLVSVCYVGPRISVKFKSTPKLAQVSIGHYYADDLIHCFSDLSNYLSQIEELALSPCLGIERITLSIEDLVFARLRKLDVSVRVYLDDNLFFFGSLVKACPFLLHFKLQLVVLKTNNKLTEKGLMKPEACPHYHLKILEVVGFRGTPIDLEIAAFLIETAVALDKITVDPRKTWQSGMPWEFEDTPRTRRARLQAERIREYLKSGTKLEII